MRSKDSSPFPDDRRRLAVSLAASLAAVALFFSCASGPSTRKDRRPTPARAAETTPRDPTETFEGPWAKLGREFELAGFTCVGIRAAGMLITLDRTRWSEMEIEGRRLREGHARLRVETSEGARDLKVDMDDSVVVAGYEIAVTYVGNVVNEETAREEPHAKFIVRRVP